MVRRIGVLVLSAGALAVVALGLAVLLYPTAQPPPALSINVTEGRVRTLNGSEYDSALRTLPAYGKYPDRVLLPRSTGLVTWLRQLVGLEQSGVEYDAYVRAPGALAGDEWAEYRRLDVAER